MRPSFFQTVTGIEALRNIAKAFGGDVLELPRDYSRLLEILHSREHLPAQAFHVGIEDISELSAFASLEVPILTSGTAQEAADMAVTASMMARSLERPVLHAFPKFWVGEEFSKIEGWPPEMWDNLPQPPGGGTAVEIFQNLCRGISDLKGRKYAICEYEGHPAADAISVGLACETLPENAIKIRLWRPFDGRRFLEGLPPTTASFSVSKPLHADVLTAVHEGIVGGWSWFVKLPPIQTADFRHRERPQEAGFRAVIRTGEATAEVEAAVHEMISDFSAHSQASFQCYTLKEPLPSLQLRIASGSIAARGPINEPQLILALDGEKLRVSGPGIRDLEIDAGEIARRAGLGSRLGPIVVSALLYYLNCESALGIPESKARDLLNETIGERWSDLSEDIVRAHQRAFESTRRALIHPGAAPGDPPRSASAPIPLKRGHGKAKPGLHSDYLGFRLNSPLIACVSAQTDFEKESLAAAGAVFFGPISEDALDREAWSTFQDLSRGRRLPGEKIRPPIDRYIEKLQSLKDAVEVPVIAGLEASSEKNWLGLAFALEQGGADALEIILKSPGEGGPADALRIASLTATALKIPVAIRITPALSDLSQNPDGLGGAKGLVLFHPPVGGVPDPETLEIKEESLVNEAGAFRLALPVIRRIVETPPNGVDLAAAGPIGSIQEALQALLAGARAVYVSAESVARLDRELRDWMEQKGSPSVGDIEIGRGQNRFIAVD